jgi:hypothetical protein
MQVELGNVLASEQLHRSDLLKHLLRELCEESPGSSSDPSLLLQLRRQLDLYYESEGSSSPQRIAIDNDTDRPILVPNIPPRLIIPSNDVLAAWRPAIIGAIIGMMIGMVGATMFFVIRAAGGNT